MPQTPEDSSKATSLSRVSGATQPPIPFIQAHHEEDLKLFPVPTKLQDIFKGRWSSSFFVSDRFRKIVSELDPVEHLFQPVDLTMIEGTRCPSGFCALGIGDRVEAIDAENFDLVAKFYDGTKFQSMKTKVLKTSFQKANLWVGSPISPALQFWGEAYLRKAHALLAVEMVRNKRRQAQHPA